MSAPVSDRTPSRVLVVEDDPDTRRMLVSALSDAGYLAVPALDGRHALRTALAVDPAAIVLDLMLPELSGDEFVREYREHHPAHEAPIVVLSAKRDGAAVAERIGACAFMAKPIDVDALVLQLESCS